MQKMVHDIEKLRKQVLLVSLDYKYIPNSRPHQSAWIGEEFVENAFSPILTRNLSSKSYYSILKTI